MQICFLPLPLLTHSDLTLDLDASPQWTAQVV